MLSFLHLQCRWELLLCERPPHAKKKLRFRGVSKCNGFALALPRHVLFCVRHFSPKLRDEILDDGGSDSGQFGADRDTGMLSRLMVWVNTLQNFFKYTDRGLRYQRAAN